MPVEKEECRFSLLSLLRTFLQGLPTAVAYPCAFSQSVFTLWLSSSHQISHFWSSLGHHGHCCVFGGFWAFWDPESAGCHFLLCRHFCGQSHMLEQRRSDRDCGPCAVKPRRSPLLPVHLQLRTAVAATTLAASQMQLPSPTEMQFTETEKYF